MYAHMVQKVILKFESFVADRAMECVNVRLVLIEFVSIQSSFLFKSLSTLIAREWLYNTGTVGRRMAQ
jgi:hypothetical protein